MYNSINVAIFETLETLTNEIKNGKHNAND